MGTVPRLVPRALPGAILLRPFRAGDTEAWAQQNRQEPQPGAIPTFHQPSLALPESCTVI
jgi:hypothetical protein